MSVISGNVPDVTEECKDLSLDFCRNKDFRFLKFQIQFSFTSTDFLYNLVTKRNFLIMSIL